MIKNPKQILIYKKLGTNNFVERFAQNKTDTIINTIQEVD